MRTLARFTFFVFLFLRLADPLAVAFAAEPPTIAIVGGPHLFWPQIAASYLERFPSQPVTWKFDRAADESTADLVFAYYPTGEEVKAASRIPSKQSLGVPVDFVAAGWNRPVNAEKSVEAGRYLDEGGIENGVRFLQYLYRLVRPDGAVPGPPIPAPQAGIYYPESPNLFQDFASYREWYGQRVAANNGAPVVAISFFGTWMRGNDLAVVNALVSRLESLGFFPVPVFGYPLDVLTPLLNTDGKFQPELVIALNASLSSPKDAAIYEGWKVPVLNGLVTRESLDEWRANPKGLPADRVAAQLGFPERSGLIAPTLVATTETSGEGVKSIQPFSAGIDAVVARGSRLLSLRSKPSAEKRVALIYYDNPAGRGNIGASYLQVFPSIRNILSALASDGYAVPQPLSDEVALRRMMESNGRNIELWAEGERARMAEAAAAPAAGVIRWPVSEYRRLYDQLPAEFRSTVEQLWGKPGESKLMTEDCPQGRCFLFPALEEGNVLLAPQPLRTTFDQASDPAHEKLTPPPHQYIAFYLWLRSKWKADALIHIGRHGTLEWLPGKQTALAPEDSPELLLEDIPNFNLYVMDGGGEAIQAKRRGYATLISHLTPMIWRAGGRADLEKLHQAFHAITDQGDTLSPAVLAEHERVVRSEVRRLGLDRQLALDMNADLKQIASSLHRFLHEIEDAPVPAGLPIFAETPTDRQLHEAVSAYLFAAFPREMHDEVEMQIPAWADSALKGEAIDHSDLPAQIASVLARVEKELPSWIESIRAAANAERNGLLSALRGEYLPSRLLGDPLRKPEALPTGANLHAVDSARIPTEAAWAVGQKMAEDFIQRYRENHKALPKRVSFVLWYGETERNQGAMESMAMALLGVRPVWNQRGLVDHLELIGVKELGRDRIDVVFTISGNYRDGFPDKVQLLDRAVRLAAQADDGVIAAQDRAVAATLQTQGVDAPQAERLGRMRIFGSKPGAYGVGVQYLVERSADHDTPGQIAALYASNMGYAYSAEQWGIPGGMALSSQLRSVDSVQFSRSSNLYSALDNDDTYQWVGGLRTAIQQFSSRAPDVYLHNLRKSGEEKAVALREWLAVELHSRQFNPQWIQEMRKSGYAGAREMSKEIEHLYGFQKTAPEHLNPETWQTVLDVFVKDKYDLGLTKFFRKENPHARQTMLARLLDIDRQGIHKFNPADRKMLLTEFARTIVADHPACNAQVCGNARLRDYVARQLRGAGKTAASTRMDQAFRRVLQKEPATVSKVQQSPSQTRFDLRKFRTHFVTIVHELPRALKVASVPSWMWVVIVLGHALVSAAVCGKLRRSRLTALQLPRVSLD